MSEPLILVCNDDGIESPGIRAAVEAVLPLGDVVIIAPSRQQTAMGRSLWGDRNEPFKSIPFIVNGRSVKAYHCNASPAQIVLYGLDSLCEGRRPALLVSGINYGENVGLAVTLSGTVGAALQSAAMGVPAVAVSVQTHVDFHYLYGEVDWTASRHFTRVFAEKLLQHRLPPDVDILKIDVPASATAATPWRVTRLARQSYYALRADTAGAAPDSAMGNRKTVIEIDHASLAADSDIHALTCDSVVSVTPLSLDLTSRVDLAALSRQLDDGR